MSLERYRLDRIVIQNQEGSVYDAARAMESNHIGLVIVADRHQIVGVITDRDLALRVVGFQLDATKVALRDVMTEQPATLSIDASEQAALELMRDRHIRRIPLLEHGTVVGLVTMDDLTLSETADLELLRDVIRAQLAEPAPFKRRGELHPTQPARYPRRGELDRLWASMARAQQTSDEAIKLVQMTTGLDTPERALCAFDAVVSACVRRITPEEAKDMLAQLPSILRDRWLELPAGPDCSVTRERLLQDLAQRLEVGLQDAEQLARSIGTALSALLSGGELDHLRKQLPKGLRELFP